MTITASSLIPTDTTATADQLWAPPALFLPDWSSGIVVRTSYVTDVPSTLSAGEVRSGLSPKPTRSIELLLMAIGQEETALLRSCLQRMAMARTPVPLFPDQTPLTAPATAGQTSFSCDTTRRRFFTGGRVAIWPATASTMTTAVEWAIIDAVADNSLTLSAALIANHAAGSLVAPVMEAELVPEASRSYITDTQGQASITFRESFGAMTLDGLVAVGDFSGVDGYEGWPVFAQPADWGQGSNSGGVSRLADTSKVGLANYTQVYGDRFKATQNASFLQMDRERAWKLLSFFDAAGGRQKPFINADLTCDFEALTALAAGATTVELKAVTPTGDWNWRTHLAFVLEDESVIVRRINYVERSGDTDTVHLAADLPTLPAPLMRVAAAYMARFDTDELVENWITDDKLRASLPAMELLREEPEDLDHMPPTPAAGTLAAPVPRPATLVARLYLSVDDTLVNTRTLAYQGDNGAGNSFGIVAPTPSYHWLDGAGGGVQPGWAGEAGVVFGSPTPANSRYVLWRGADADGERTYYIEGSYGGYGVPPLGRYDRPWGGFPADFYIVLSRG